MRYFLYILLGFIYSMVLTFFGLVMTGMGHGKGTSLFWTISLLPIPLIFWSLIGFLLCRAESKNYRIAVYILLAIHYLSSFINYAYVLETSQYESFSTVYRRDTLGVIFTCLFYLAGQIFIFYKLSNAKSKPLR